MCKGERNKKERSKNKKVQAHRDVDVKQGWSLRLDDEEEVVRADKVPTNFQKF